MLARKELDQAGQELLDMVGYIRDHGWCQNELEDANGRVCILGAASRLFHDRMRFCESIPGLEKFVRYVTSTDSIYEDASIEYWNDVPGRTEQEVLDTLTDAAYSSVE